MSVGERGNLSRITFCSILLAWSMYFCLEIFNKANDRTIRIKLVSRTSMVRVHLRVKLSRIVSDVTSSLKLYIMLHRLLIFLISLSLLLMLYIFCSKIRTCFVFWLWESIKIAMYIDKVVEPKFRDANNEKISNELKFSFTDPIKIDWEF